MSAAPEYNDQAFRLAAFDAVRRLTEVRGDLTGRDLSAGFEIQGERIPLINPQRGIFKPRQMRHLLSIRTVFPRSGARVWYDDQRDVHRQIYEGDESVDYAFMGADPDAADNRWLRDAMENRVPVIYFLGVAPGCYQAIAPTFVVGWDPRALKASVVFGLPGEAELYLPETSTERRYALREVKQRIHQASFRDAVIAAYRGRCALVWVARAVAPGRSSYHCRRRRAVGATCCAQRTPAFQDPSCSVRCSPDRHRSRFSNPRIRATLKPRRRSDARSVEAFALGTSVSSH